MWRHRVAPNRNFLFLLLLETLWPQGLVVFSSGLPRPQSKKEPFSQSETKQRGEGEKVSHLSGSTLYTCRKKMVVILWSCLIAFWREILQPIVYPDQEKCGNPDDKNVFFLLLCLSVRLELRLCVKRFLYRFFWKYA